MSNDSYLQSVKKQFSYYKALAEKTFAQLTEEQLFWQYNEESNSIAIISKHLAGNMLSRWTDIFNTDGEKEWRNRDAEFENDFQSKTELLDFWDKGWNVFQTTLESLTDEDLEKIIYIRNQGHTVLEAINRQLAHYPYHVGQIVFIGKMICNQDWESLSIPRNTSANYNQNMFNKPKHREHFTDETLNTNNK
ncbi:DinB superfamily protein [Elizabethkingia miricola]|nr:DinB superfamily protein [Elizabethkingia miricola]